jgi:Excreted virulence factor EspC, type VII ESX diderm
MTMLNRKPYDLRMDGLRVDPGVLHTVAGQIHDMADQLGAGDVGPSLSTAANAVSGLQTSGACMKAATAFDNALHQLGSALAAFSDSMRTAGRYYEFTDATTGQNISRAGAAQGR